MFFADDSILIISHNIFPKLKEHRSLLLFSKVFSGVVMDENLGWKLTSGNVSKLSSYFYEFSTSIRKFNSLLQLYMYSY